VAGRVPEPWFGVAALAALALSLPAMLMVLGLERSLLRALDPRRFVPLMFQGGVAYLVIAALAALLLDAAPELLPSKPTAEELAGGRADGRGVLYAYAVFYSALVAAHALGAAVFLRRDAFGFRPMLQPVTADEEAEGSSQDSVARLLKLADEEEHHQRHPQATQLLLTGSMGAHAPHPWLEELFAGACRRPKPYFAEAAGQRLIAHLVGARRWSRALEVVVLAAQRWPRFQPASRDERVALAGEALARGNALAFQQLTERLDELGEAPQAVDLGLLVARWRHERDGDAPGARAALAPLLARREHPAHRRVVALDAALRDAPAR
jgi:hypothetical protein